MDGNPCWLNFKQKNSNFNTVLVFMTTLLTLAKVEASLCKQGWSEWNNMCYKLNQTSQLNWSSSQSFCAADGANLVSIGSEEEYLFVSSLLQDASVNDIWIGLHDSDTEGHFQWVDQSPLVFTNMSNTETNSVGINCVQMRSGNNKIWIPYYCIMDSHFLCKYVPSVIMEDYSIQANYTRQQLFTSMPNKLLLNHVFSKKSAPSLLHCTLFCLRDAKCMSLNYRSPRDSQIQNGLCLLNLASAEEFPEDFVDNSAYIYALPIK